MTAAAKKNLLSTDSSSDCSLATVFVPQHIPMEPPVGSPVTLETNVAAMLQSSRPYYRLHSCRSCDPERASNFDASESVLDVTVQLVVTEPGYNFRLVRKCKNSAHDSPSFRDVKNTVDLITDLLWAGGLVILSCAAHQFAVCHSSFCAHESMQDDGSFSSSASTSRDT